MIRTIICKLGFTILGAIALGLCIATSFLGAFLLAPVLEFILTSIAGGYTYIFGESFGSFDALLITVLIVFFVGICYITGQGLMNKYGTHLCTGEGVPSNDNGLEL